MKSFFFLTCISLSTAFRCLNFYGIETEYQKPVCSWKHPPEWYMQQAKEKMQIDTLRIPFSYSYGSCSNFRALDEIIASAERQNLSVVLDYHRGYDTHQGESPVEGVITEDDWINMLLHVADRYQQHPHVVAIDLFNEPQKQDTLEYERLYRNAVLAIETQFPQRYDLWVGCADWGKDCSTMWQTLPSNRTVVSVHTYSFAGSDWETRFPPSGVVGEIGWRMNDTEWLQDFTTFVQRSNINGLCLWTVAHSDDTDNLFDDDCETINDNVIQAFDKMFSKRPYLRGNSICSKKQSSPNVVTPRMAFHAR